MTKQVDNIKMLEELWSVGGFLHFLRRDGQFEQGSADEFLSKLNSIEFEEEEYLPRRLVSLLWYLPTFLIGQDKQITRVGGDLNAYVNFRTKAVTILERILGLP